MGDNVDLLAPRPLHDQLDPCGKLTRAFLDGQRGLMLSVVNGRAVQLEGVRYPPPIVEKPRVAEKDAVNE